MNNKITKSKLPVNKVKTDFFIPSNDYIKESVVITPFSKKIFRLLTLVLL